MLDDLIDYSDSQIRFFLLILLMGWLITATVTNNNYYLTTTATDTLYILSGGTVTDRDNDRTETGGLMGTTTNY